MFWCFRARKVLHVIKQKQMQASLSTLLLGAWCVQTQDSQREFYLSFKHKRKIHKIMGKHLACSHWAISDLWQQTFTSMHIYLYTPALCAGNISSTRTVVLQMIVADTDTFGCFKFYVSSPTESSSSSTLSWRMTSTFCTFSTAPTACSAVGVFPLRIQSGAPLTAKEK